MNSIQSICENCYGIRYPYRIPVRTSLPYREDNPEFCCDCAEKTQSGIYFWVDPDTVKFSVGSAMMI